MKIFFMMTLFFYTFSNAQSRRPVDRAFVDSVIQQNKTLPNNLDKVMQLTRNAGLNRYTQPTRRLIDEALRVANESGEARLLGHAHYSLGNFYYYSSKIDSCLSNLDKAYNYIDDQNEPLLKSSILSTKGGAYNKLGAVLLAISTQIEAKQILDQINTTEMDEKTKGKYNGQVLTINNSLANLYNKTEDFEKAIEYYDICYAAAVKMGGPSVGNSGIILSNKGNLLIKMNRPEEALKILKEAREIKIRGNLPERFIANSDLNIGMAFFKMGDYDNATVNYQKAMDVYKKFSYQKGLMEGYTNQGILYAAKGEIKKAQENCALGKEIASRTADSEYLIKSCECLYEVNKDLGNYEISLANHEQFNRIKDSLFNERNVRKVTEAGMQYEFDQKDAEQQRIIEQKNRQKNQILFGLIGLVVFAVTVFFFLRKRLKYQKTISSQSETLQKQKIIELQQSNKLTAMNSMIEGQEAERLRIAKDLHDSLGGLLSTVKAHFSTIQVENTGLEGKPLAKKTTELIDEACIEVRRISHNMMPHALSISGLEGAVQDIAENLRDQGFNATFEASQLPKIEATKEVMIYRLVQEIVSNIRKHAEAKSVFIQLFGYKEEVNLIIEDDGKGFNYEKALLKGGLGLKNINSRVQFLDGNVDWDSTPGHGTTINIHIPLKK